MENALDYVAAYTAGNDISSRKLQRDPNLAGRVPQWGFSKGFDTFAPLGPALVSSELIGDPKELRLKTVVDGETRQDESVSDLLFDSAYLVSYLSQGTTLQKGSVIMTGTPGGKPTLQIDWPFHRCEWRMPTLTVWRCRRWFRIEASQISRSRYQAGGGYL